MYLKLEKPEFDKQKELYLKMDKNTLAEMLAMRDIMDYDMQQNNSSNTYTIKDEQITVTVPYIINKPYKDIDINKILQNPDTFRIHPEDSPFYDTCYIHKTYCTSNDCTKCPLNSNFGTPLTNIGYYTTCTLYDDNDD